MVQVVLEEMAFLPVSFYADRLVLATTFTAPRFQSIFNPMPFLRCTKAALFGQFRSIFMAYSVAAAPETRWSCLDMS